MSATVSLQQATYHDPFAARLADDGQSLARQTLTTLQWNLGKMCNLACKHCHVEAAPRRKEIMSWETMQGILGWIDRYREDLPLRTMDLTGGAPEMNPHFRQLVEALSDRGLHMIDRCNLTILLEEGYETMPAFLAKHRLEITASLPCYLADNVDGQRGRGVYQESIDVLQKLNALGYGHPDSGLTLDLVYNPTGYNLPPAQEALEEDYKQYLEEHFGIVFNRLFTITNMPIKRFEHALRRDGEYDGYMAKLSEAHNMTNVDAVMCRYLVSVGWRGSVYDCDFNQMLQLSLDPEEHGPGWDEHVVEAEARKLWDFTPEELIGRSIRTGGHCFGCTAGAGSSCTGSLG